MEYHQITLNEWADMKEQLRRELNNVRQSFVRVGYVLRRMEDTKAYEAEGYRSVAEFAEKEHGLKPSTTSRWMSINREFSLDGYSNTLDPKYIDMNASQLQEMLTMSAEDRELVTPDMRREDIRELKRLGNMPEERGGFKEIVEKFFGEFPDILREVQKMMEATSGNAALIELVNPSGTRSYRKDGAMIFLYEDKVKYKAAGHSPEVRHYNEFFEIAEAMEMTDTKEVDDGSGEGRDSGPAGDGTGLGESGGTFGDGGKDLGEPCEAGGPVRAGGEETDAGKESRVPTGPEHPDETVCETEDREKEDSADQAEEEEPEGCMNAPAGNCAGAIFEEEGDSNELDWERERTGTGDYAANCESVRGGEKEEQPGESVPGTEEEGNGGDEEAASGDESRGTQEGDAQPKKRRTVDIGKIPSIVDEKGKPSPERMTNEEHWALFRESVALIDRIREHVCEYYDWDTALFDLEDLRTMLIQLQKNDAKEE